MRFELRLASGRTVEWDGADEDNAARRYLDGHRDETVGATRSADRHGIFVWGRHSRILEPGDNGW